MAKKKKKERTALDDLREELGLGSNEEYIQENLRQSIINARNNKQAIYEKAKKQNEEQQTRVNDALKNYYEKRGSLVNDKGLSYNDMASNLYQAGFKRFSLNDNVPKTTMQRQKENSQGKEITRFSLEDFENMQNIANQTKEKRNLEQEQNTKYYTQYLEDYAKVDMEDVDIWDKLNILRSAYVGLENALSPRQYKDENGNLVDLPSYSELKSNKTMEELGTIGKAVHGAAQSIGQMAPAMAVGLIPGVGKVGALATTFVTSYNSAKNQKLLEGYSEEKANSYAILNAGLETGLGRLIGGATKIMGGSSSPLAKNLSTITEKVIKNKGVSRILGHLGAEEAEELTQMVLDPINEYVTLGKYENLGDALSTLDGEEAGITALSTLITIGLTEGKTSYDVSKLQKNIEQVNKQYGTDFKLKTNAEIINNQILKNKIVDNIKAQEINTIEQTKQELENNFQNGLITEEQYSQEINNLSNRLRVFTDEIKNNENNPITEIEVEKQLLDEEFNNNQITEEEYNNRLSTLDNSLKELSSNNQITTNTNKIDIFRETANEYWDNSKESQEVKNVIEKVIKDKGYNIILDPTIGNNVGGLATTNQNGEVEIRLNPNSNRTVEFLLTHEVTHAIETDEMKNLVMDYASKNTEFNKALESLKQTYNSEDVSSEVLADISGQLLGNQEFILNLSTTKPNIFKRMYDAIISFANKITGNSKEALFVRDLKNKWEEAYRTQNNGLNTIKYHISENFSNEIDEVLNGTYKSNNQVKARDYTPQVLVENGVSDLPMLMTAKHVKSTIYSINEAQNLGLPTKNVNYHALGKERLLNVIDSLDNPLEIYKTSKDNYLVITEILDDNGRNVVVPIKIDGKGTYNDVYIDENQIKSAYGRNNLEKYLKNNNFEKIYTKKGTTLNERVRYPNIGNSITDTISQSNKNVKSDNVSTKYSIQENTNNTQELDNSSFSIENKPTWQKFLDDNYKTIGKRTNMADIRRKPNSNTNTNTESQTSQNKSLLPINKDVKKAVEPIKKDITDISKQITEIRKALGIKNPTEISKLTKEDANTTPKLPNKKVSTGSGDSSFFENVTKKTKMLSEKSRDIIKTEDDVAYYEKVTNEESLSKAMERLDTGGQNETLSWFNKDSRNADSTDVAEGWILLKQYQDAQDYDSMVEVAKKMREIGTKAGQTVQAFNIMERLTPEGMVKYAQSELSEAYDKMIKNKTNEWIEQHRSDFDLKPAEVEFIMRNMEDVSKMEDGYDKRVKLAEIQKLMTDKLPPERGAGVKAWMRISMLFNPKTQVRNIVGNALISPVNMVGDTFASMIDRQIAKKTGVRTTGITNLKNYTKGMKEGLYQSYNDFKKGINTRNVQGNRFEIGEGKSFNNKTIIGKGLNRVDNMLSFMLDAGDRAFYEASFTNSINNQLVLNKTDIVTQDMIDIATEEALSRTWQDNNKFTQFVLRTRKGLNNLAGNENFGLGDVLIPFAKTPANLTKALIDYSPAGVISTLTKGIKLNKSLNNGQYTPQMQHQFVQSLGKATAGTMLYVLGYALAKSGVISGDGEDDKDAANFLKNTLGINNYSIKIGNKSFTYDWAQPVAGAFSIMANIVNSEEKEKALLEAVVGNLDTAGSILLEQSFLQSINDVINNNDGAVSGMITEILELPSRAIPTFSKQIADMIDGTQRTSFEKGSPIKTSINQVKAKIPFVSKTLAPSVDSLGREIQKYGGKNNVFNVFFNPANLNSENVNEAGKELYRLYKETGDKTIMPRVVPYTVEINEKKKDLSSVERAKYQKESGKIVEEEMNRLLKSSKYKNLSNEEKVEVTSDIINYAYNKIQEKMFGKEIASEYKNADKFVSKGGTIADYYRINNNLKLIENEYEYNKDLLNENSSSYDSEKEKLSLTKRKDIINTLINENLSVNAKAFIYNKYYGSEETTQAIINSGIDFNEYLKFARTEYKSDKDKNGDTIKDSRKEKIINAIDKLELSDIEKAMLIRLEYTSFDNYNYEILKYIDSLELSKNQKEEILETFGFEIKGGRVYW